MDFERYLSVDLASGKQAVDAALAELAQTRAVERLWAHDPTLWKPRPEDNVELSNRMGWLTLPSDFLGRLGELNVHLEPEPRHVVLCGMGGSSLAPEVFRITFGTLRQAHGERDHLPELIVLDCTDPCRIKDIDAQIDPQRTLFVISSKSGGTLEVMSFFAHFYELAHEQGDRFVAITDPGTSLEKLAHEKHFTTCFGNPTEIGGRYSALSFFGLVPAALIGTDVQRLLQAAQVEQDLCHKADDNPGAWLGAYMGGLARSGRDKLTILTTPGLQSFGLWVEQLIAESTGKEGKGIVPIVGEPIGAASAYADDRAFVALRLEGDDSTQLDRVVAELSGQHPVVVRTLHDRHELGAEMYCWEVATALSGELLHINPFDQPNVQESKDNTARVLQAGDTRPPDGTVMDASQLAQFLSQTHAGDYVALQAYVTPSAQAEAALQQLRARIRDKHKTATTLGFGPRFLHSTGQLHKGGPPSGVFLQFTYEPPEDLPIPGKPFSFRTLFAAQSLGDLQSLHGRKLRVARLDLGRDPLAALQRLTVD